MSVQNSNSEPKKDMPGKDSARPTVLLSAMHLEDKSILERLGITGNVIVINQCDKNDDETYAEKERTVRFVSSTERGLSKSRNLAVSLAEGGICVYCDNDVKYHDDYESRIMKAYARHTDADIIVFFVKRPERSKPVKEGDSRLGYLRSMKIFSPEISFKKESLKRAGLRMDEDFGAGARYGMGEENIFLFDAIKKGLSVWYVGEEIASLIPTKSTWFNGYSPGFFRNRGAGYYRMSGLLFPFLVMQFAIRKRGLYAKDGIGMFSAVKYMLEGKKEYVSSHDLRNR